MVAGHDRGGRVAHRLCLDHPAAVEKVALLDVAPTLTMYNDTNKEFATKYVWWFLQIQPAPMPEHLIGLDPVFYLRDHLAAQGKTPGAISPRSDGRIHPLLLLPRDHPALCAKIIAQRPASIASILLQALVPLFFVLALGYAVGRYHFFDGDQATGFNTLLVNFALPAMLFDSTVATTRSQLLGDTKTVDGTHGTLGGARLCCQVHAYRTGSGLLRDSPTPRNTGGIQC